MCELGEADGAEGRRLQQKRISIKDGPRQIPLLLPMLHRVILGSIPRKAHEVNSHTASRVVRCKAPLRRVEGTHA